MICEQEQGKGQSASGPVIRDVTEIFEDDSDGNTDDNYSSPTIDSPAGPEDMLSFTENELVDNAEMLLSIDPSSVNLATVATSPQQPNTSIHQHSPSKGKRLYHC